MNRRKTILFVVLAYGITWAFWGRLALRAQLDVPPWPHLLGGLGPFLAALTATLVFDGPAGLARWITDRLLRFPSWKWMLVGVGMPLVLFLLSVMVLGLVQGEWVAVSQIGQNAKMPPNHTLAIWGIWCLFFGLGEEGGWRGFLFPEFTKRYPARIATLYVAFIWAPWHLPVFFYDKDFMAMGLSGIFGWTIGLVFGSLLLGWLVKQSRWSLWPVVLWHGTFNLFTTSDQLSPFLPGMMSALVILIVLWIARHYGPQLDRS